MAAPANIIPTVKLTTRLPIDVKTQMDLYLYSEVEARVPKGAYQRFLSARIREFFTLRALDLAPYLGTSPGTVFVSGSPSAIGQLKEKLENLNVSKP